MNRESQTPARTLRQPTDDGRRTTDDGFTLLEVLLTIAISAVILISAYSSLKSGWIAYNKLNTRTQSYHNIRNGLNTLSRDLRNSFLFKAADENSKIKFQGTSSQMSFASLIKSKDEKGENYIESAKIYYKFEDNKLLKALIKGKDILKTSTTEPEYKTSLAKISELKFEYARQESSSSQKITWLDKYEETNSLPLAVRVSLSGLTQTIKLFQATASEQ